MQPDQREQTVYPAKALIAAKNAAGDFAVRAAERGDHGKSRAWADLAVRIDGLFRVATELQA